MQEDRAEGSTHLAAGVGSLSMASLQHLPGVTEYEAAMVLSDPLYDALD